MVLFFYIFAALLIGSSFMVIFSRNPVHAVLWLIFCFCNGAGLMVLLGAEFIAMMLIIIYVGAVAVLFLFVVMMLDIKSSVFRATFDAEIGITIFIAALLFIDIVAVILLSHNKDILVSAEYPIMENISNSQAIGRLLYTDFILPFQTAGIVLLVAMIACISLTLRLRPGVKRQSLGRQMARTPANSLRLSKPEIGKGIKGIIYGGSK